MGLPGRSEFWTPARIVGTIVVIVASLLMVVSVAVSTSLCHATYHCPANGCGDVPQRNCANGLTLVWSADLVAGPALAIALSLLLWSGRSRQSRGARPSPA
jgi:hypothetical protein